MQTVSGLFLGLGFACALAGIVHLLSPGGRTERVLRLLTTLFILASILSSLREIPFSISADLPQKNETESVEKIVLENAKKAIEKSARSVLEKYGFSDAEIRIEMEVRNGEAHTKYFRISGTDEKNEQEITDEIFALTGERPVMENAAASVDDG